MANTYRSYKKDTAKETEGVWHDLADGSRIRIARAGGGNNAYNEKFVEKWKPLRRLQATNTLSEDVAHRVMVEVYADSIVKGWEGITGPDGQSLPFNRENVIKIFTDLKDLFAEVRNAAQDEAVYLDESLAKDAENLPPA